MMINITNGGNNDGNVLHPNFAYNENDNTANHFNFLLD